MTDGCGISSAIALRWTSGDLNDDKSTLVQVMAWCHKATSHYLNQCWPRSLPPYRVTRSQWVKSMTLCKTTVTPFLLHWTSYPNLALSHLMSYSSHAWSYSLFPYSTAHHPSVPWTSDVSVTSTQSGQRVDAGTSTGVPPTCWSPGGGRVVRSQSRRLEDSVSHCSSLPGTTSCPI